LVVDDYAAGAILVFDFVEAETAIENIGVVADTAFECILTLPTV